MWDAQITFLRDNRINSMTIDFPGFGNTPVNPRLESMTQYAREIFQLHQKLKISRAIFVGLSMGGYVALALYKEHPEIFYGLVLANTRATADNDETRHRRNSVIQELVKTKNPAPVITQHTERFFTPHFRQSHPEIVESTVKWMKNAQLAGIIQAQKAMSTRENLQKLLPDIRFPVLVIAGEQDTLIPVSEGRGMAEELSQGELKIIRDAAHLSNLEKPQEFNKYLIQYYRKIAKNQGN